YEPSIFVGTHSISKEQQLELSFVRYVLERLQRTLPVAGKIIGMDGTSHTVKLDHHSKALTPLLEPLQEWVTVDSPTPPPLVLNKHCPLCPFQRMCQTQAEQEDNLSLLHGMTARMIRQYERKGIFTVKQLSYLFKPRKRKRGSRKPPPATHKVELQALAIREKKIYLQALPTLSRQPVELFVDMEGVPDRGLYYLIGLLVCQGDSTAHHAFWADTDQDERHIWQQFVDMVTQYPGAPIYHYGSYEPRAIATLAKRYETDAESVTKRLINVNKHIYGKVYFPVRSNGLKDIGHYIGAKWTSPIASGLQSLVWRHQWDTTYQANFKNMLLTYNAEDCYVLKFLVDELSKIQLSADTLTEVDFADKRKQFGTELSKEVHSQFDSILKFAHFKYDKTKISFRQDTRSSELQHDRKGRQSYSAYMANQKWEYKRRKAARTVQVKQGKICPECGHEPLYQRKQISERTITDLVLTRSMVRKVITRYVGAHEFCVKCRKIYFPPDIRKYGKRQLYGDGFSSWVVYQRIALRMPYDSIIETLKEYFNEKLSPSLLPGFMQSAGQFYVETEKSIIQHLLESPFIHADETPINIWGAQQYAWVFTNGTYVIFKLTETREATITHEFLVNYNGILISDFYPGYDSVRCRQQKCWVHLIRDLNDDLRAAPFDTEFEIFILEVRNLIVPIMQAIQKYGL